MLHCMNPWVAAWQLEWLRNFHFRLHESSNWVAAWPHHPPILAVLALLFKVLTAAYLAGHASSWCDGDKLINKSTPFFAENPHVSSEIHGLSYINIHSYEIYGMKTIIIWKPVWHHMDISTLQLDSIVTYSILWDHTLLFYFCDPGKCRCFFLSM